MPQPTSDIPRLLSRPPLFGFRRDFADELGFGSFLLKTVDGAIDAQRREARNRALRLSPAIPQFMGYFTESGMEAMTADGINFYRARMNVLFWDMLGRLDDAVRADPDLQALFRDLRYGDLVHAENRDTIGNLVVHCSWTGRAWFAGASPELFHALSTQP
jgi:hypothetical protein